MGKRVDVVVLHKILYFCLNSSVENLGNIIFVKAFDEFVREVGFSVVLCRPHDPQSNGKIEEVVHHIKDGFLQGRVYTGTDALNSECLAWLDREGNATPDCHCRFPQGIAARLRFPQISRLCHLKKYTPFPKKAEVRFDWCCLLVYA